MIKEISIIIVNYNSARDTIKAIESFFSKEKKFFLNQKYEFIIVDNNSNDLEKKILNEIKFKYNNIKIIFNKNNYGFGKANNIGVANAQYENILFFNADAYLIDKFLEESIRMIEGKKIDILGIQLLNEDGTKQASCGYFPNIRQSIMELVFLNKINILRGLARPIAFKINKDKILEVDYVSGACFYMKKSKFIEVGGFDENIFLYFEETDLCARLKKSGGKIKILNSESVKHVGSSIVGQYSIFKARCFYESYIYFLNKHHIQIKKILYIDKLKLSEKIMIAILEKNDMKIKYYKKGLDIIDKYLKSK